MCKSLLQTILLAVALMGDFARSAVAQVVVVPHGFEDGPAKYLIAAISLALLGVAVWRFLRARG
jgi:hypothetical protein